MIQEKFNLKSLVLQPTTLCQLDCSYCYLPDRKLNKKMELSTLMNTLENLFQVDREYLNDEITIFWHSGEPLLRGIEFFRSAIDLISEFGKHRNIQFAHSIQTNAVIINKEWCDFFKEYRIDVGVSIDGVDENNARVFYNQKSAWTKIMKGIGLLTENNVKFATISVINSNETEDIESWYQFIQKLSPTVVGINFQEKIGTSEVRSKVNTESFWKNIIGLWKQNNFDLPLREFEKVYYTLSRPSRIQHNDAFDNPDFFMGISFDGNVSLLSPEFVEITKEQNKFIVGNVNVSNTQIAEIVQSVHEGRIEYINDFLRGRNKCKADCDYFNFCGGGSPANKFYENGTLDSTMTEYCRSEIIEPVNVLIEHFSN